ncbi:MAG: hypothetical protein J6D36_05260, partial [Erysipelotrichaceae bacterium]|nr:hypothetical protein [Erysipelotrichaceae bacterium]
QLSQQQNGDRLSGRSPDESWLMVTGINVLSHIIDGFTHVDPSLLYYFGLIMHFGKIQWVQLFL